MTSELHRSYSCFPCLIWFCRPKHPYFRAIQGARIAIRLTSHCRYSSHHTLSVSWPYQERSRRETKGAPNFFHCWSLYLICNIEPTLSDPSTYTVTSADSSSERIDFTRSMISDRRGYLSFPPRSYNHKLYINHPAPFVLSFWARYLLKYPYHQNTTQSSIHTSSFGFPSLGFPLQYFQGIINDYLATPPV